MKSKMLSRVLRVWRIRGASGFLRKALAVLFNAAVYSEPEFSEDAL